MEIEQAITGKLTSDVAVSALIGSRVFPGQAPQRTPLPLLVYTEASQRVLYSMNGPIKLNSYGMHLDVWATSYEVAKQVYHAVRACLSGFRGDLGAGNEVAVRGIFEESGSDQAEPPIHAEEQGLWRAGLDLSIWYGN